MLKPYIKRLLEKIDLSTEETRNAARLILDNAPATQVAAFLTALTAKGETSDELSGLIQAVNEQAIPVTFDYPVVDIVGTGGDRSNSINISTASALLASACGIKVLKHGNRAASSRCGSADVLEALGFPINQTVEQIKEAVDKTNFGFCFAPNFHPVLARVRDIRRSLGIPTVFNLLGPLCNPARAQHLLMGVYDPNKVELIARTLHKLGSKRSLVFSGHGLDELSCLGVINALLVTPQGIEPFKVDPQSLGLRKCTIEDLAGQDALYNSGIISKTLSGVDTPLTDTLILNAALALFIYSPGNSTLTECVNKVKARLAQGNILPENRLHKIVMRKRKEPQKRKSLKDVILTNPNGAVIAEIKRASPSAGKIADIIDPVARAKQYVECGAAAISVLTDEGFEGSMADLAAVAKALRNTPAAILCKDFFLCPEQIAEAAAAGADAILIMVSVLHNDTARMVRIAHDFGLETLVEVHHQDELAIALASGGDVIGINQRDLRDFSMHPEIFTNLIEKLPANVAKVAESGIETRDDALKAYQLGYNAVLVGTALSKLANPRDFFIKE